MSIELYNYIKDELKKPVLAEMVYVFSEAASLIENMDYETDDSAKLEDIYKHCRIHDSMTTWLKLSDYITVLFDICRGVDKIPNFSYISRAIRGRIASAAIDIVIHKKMTEFTEEFDCILLFIDEVMGEIHNRNTVNMEKCIKNTGLYYGDLATFMEKLQKDLLDMNNKNENL